MRPYLLHAYSWLLYVGNFPMKYFSCILLIVTLRTACREYKTYKRDDSNKETGSSFYLKNKGSIYYGQHHAYSTT